jgi:hypothetical protein
MTGWPFPNSAQSAGGDFDGAFFDVALELLGREHAVAEDVPTVFLGDELIFRLQEFENALVSLQTFPGRSDDTDDFAFIKAGIGYTNLIVLASWNDCLNQFFDPRCRKGAVCLWHGLRNGVFKELIQCEELCVKFQLVGSDTIV